MTDSPSSNINNAAAMMGGLMLVAALFFFIINVLFSILKVAFALTIMSFARYLIPQFIRAAVAKLFSPLVAIIAPPLSLMMLDSLARYYEARSNVLHLRQEIQDAVNASQSGMPHIWITPQTQIFLTRYEKELAEVPYESAATIAGAAAVLTVTAPFSGVIATAAATTLGANLGALAYNALTYGYNYMRGISNTPDQDAFINALNSQNISEESSHYASLAIT